ncbi:MAG: hypothetical protein QOJ19_3538 [Acidimicrobiia bacterium]|jgi:uncharacterized membrane protein|nr:hypothetical protein [Acidimicrobiia bacterium]
MVDQADHADRTERRHELRMVAARTRVLLSLVAGMCVAGPTAIVAPWEVTTLILWSATAIVFLAWVWAIIWPADAIRTRAIATREDDSRAAADLVLILASMASLVGVGFVLVKASEWHGRAEAALIGLAVFCVVLAWTAVQTVYTLRYAHLFWTARERSARTEAVRRGSPAASADPERSPAKAIDFNGDDDPSYADFAYLAFTVGMTYQVSDTAIRAAAIRRTLMKHALMSYLFGTVIVAMTINLVVGLAK